MCTDTQARAQAENWMRYILGGQIGNLHGFFQPEKQAILPYEEYHRVYCKLDLAIAQLEEALAIITQIQTERKIP